MTMTLQEFDDLLDRHGGDAARWPIALRPGAEALVAVSPDARARLAAMREVEAWLASTSLANGAGRQGNADRTAAIAMRHRQMSDRPADARPVRKGPGRSPAVAATRGGNAISGRVVRASAGWGAAAAAALALGIFVGSLAPVPHEDSAGQILASALDTSGSVDVE